ncbi:hypothetical protein Gotur_027355 [Gossypium turneri]
MPTLNQLIQDSIRGLNATQELRSMRIPYIQLFIEPGVESLSLHIHCWFGC